MRGLALAGTCAALLGTAFGGVAEADIGGSLTTPSGFAAAATSSGVRLRWDWNQEPFVAGYDVERRLGSGSWTRLDSTWRNDYVDATAVRGSRYTYRLTVRSATGALSATATSAEVTAGADTTAPTSTAVRVVGASGGNGNVTFAWDWPSDPSITGVGVDRKGPGETTFTWYGTFDSSEDHWVDDWRIVNGGTYEYRFYAQDATGLVLQRIGSGTSVRAVAGTDTTAPATPSGLTTWAGDGEARLTWTRNSDPDVVRYEVRGRRCAASTWVDWGRTAERRFLARWLVDDTQYCFQLRAVDASGNASAWTSSATVTPDRATIRMGLNGGSDFSESWILPLYDDVGFPDTRVELDATRDPAGASPAAAIDALTDRGVRPLILAGYGRSWPTRTEVQTFCANAAATYGPGGSAGLSDDVAIRYIEFGNESSYSYMPTTMYRDPDTYAVLLHACVDAATAANPFVGVLAIADDPTGVGWVRAIYREMPDADAKLSGWTTHPYGPPTATPGSFWPYSIDSAVSGTSGSSLPLIATELGIATTRNGTTLNDNFGWPRDMTWSRGAAALDQVIDVFYDDYPRLTQVYWYVLHDGAVDNGVNNDREAFFGLFQYDVDTAKGDLFTRYLTYVGASLWH